MSRLHQPTGNQRGIALIVAMLVLVFLSLLASGLMMSVDVDTKITGRAVREQQALNVAEAGIAEAMERIRKGDVPDNENPRMVSVIFLAPSGSIPVMGADSVALPTWQIDDQKWLSYSTPVRSPEMLTVTYKTDPARTKIYRYDSTKNPAIQTSSGTPIFVVNSTGHFGDATRAVVSEILESPIKSFAKGAVVAKKKVHTAHLSYLCGFNHQMSTPEWTNVPNGRNGDGNSCNDDLTKQLWEVGSNDLVGVWTGEKINDVNKAKEYGTPSGYLTNQPGFYSGCWDVLGMTQDEFFGMLGPYQKKHKLQGELDGITYIDPDGHHHGGDLELKNVDGEGLLYVDADHLHIKGNFTYRGLIYCTGKIVFEGKDWVLGSVVSEKDIHIHSHDKDTSILYSKDAIEQYIAKYGAPFVTLSWREKPIGS